MFSWAVHAVDTGLQLLILLTDFLQNKHVQLVFVYKYFLSACLKRALVFADFCYFAVAIVVVGGGDGSDGCVVVVVVCVLF